MCEAVLVNEGSSLKRFRNGFPSFRRAAFRRTAVSGRALGVAVFRGRGIEVFLSAFVCVRGENEQTEKE